MDKPREPYEIVIELIRGESSDERFELPVGPRIYLREEGGRVRRSVFSWDEQVRAELAELGKPRPDRNAVQRLGDKLRAFLSPLGWDRHEAELQRALKGGRPVSLVLRFAAAELYTLPWELLALESSGLHLGELPGFDIRYEWSTGEPASRSTAPAGGRLLFAWSAAGGAVPAPAHLSALRQAFARGEVDFEPGGDVLAKASLERLGKALAEAKKSGRAFTALHLLCHGGRSGETPGLWLNDPTREGEAEFVDAGSLRGTLEPYAEQLRLVVLCACEGGDAPELLGNNLGSVAQALHRVGIPAVLASRLLLSSQGSVDLTETLYTELLVQLAPLQRAVTAVRSRLRRGTTRLDWASIQLYAYAHEGPGFYPFVFQPYRGLLAFEARHRRFFFGQEPLWRQLRRRVLDASLAQHPRFLVVTGASGIGKSSLVMAGLAPSLPDETWSSRVLRPGDGGALPEVERLRRAPPERKLLLIVDQLEEMFTRMTPPERQDFGRALWELARREDSNVFVVATLRVDFAERCAEIAVEEHLRLDAVVSDERHRVFVPRLDPAQYAALIEEPARMVGLAFEAGLAEKLLRDVGQDPGALSLLAYALEQLWQQRDGNRLTHRAYEDMVGVQGALPSTMERLYAALSPEEQREARRLLVELVDIRGESTAYTRRRVRLTRIRPQEAGARVAFDSALERLLAQRLLAHGEDVAPPPAGAGALLEISHEALIRRWKRLKEWIQEDRARVLQLRELRGWAEAWEARRGNPDGGASYLLTGDRLGDARALREKYAGELGEEAIRFTDESQRHADAQRLRDEEQQHRLKGMVALTSAGRLSSSDPTLALLLLREVKTDLGLAWTQAVLDSLQKPVSSAILAGHAGAIRAAAFSPDGARVLTASDDGTARLSRTDGAGEPLVLAGHADSIRAAAFSPDGARVLTASDDGTARLWRADGTGKPLVLAGHTGAVRAATFSPDGARVLTVSDDCTARLWRADGTGKPLVLAGHSRAINAAAFSPDGARVLTASDDRTARLWRADGIGKPLILSGHDGALNTAAFSPDGARVLTASDDGTARVWRADGAGKPLVLAGRGGAINAAAFSPDGARVLTASSDGATHLWRADGAGEPLVLAGRGGAVNAAAFSPDGAHVLTASADGTARLWRADGAGEPLVLAGHSDSINAAAFSLDGARVLTASDDGTARLWRAGGAREPLVLAGHADSIRAAAFSPDGARILTASADGTARLWRADGAGEPLVLAGHFHALLTAAFSPDGARVLTASADGTARLWRADGAGEPLVLAGHADAIRAATFSPDGARVLTASADSTACLWRADQAGEPLVLAGHFRAINAAVFSPDGARVLTASDDGTARLWRTDGAGKPLVLTGHAGFLNAAAFSPDGARVLTASDDGTARVWRADGAGTPLVFAGHDGAIRAATFSPRGARVLTASDDSTARIWRADGSGTPVVLAGHDGAILSAAFSPDGTRVLTTSADGTVRLWRADGSGTPLILTGHAGGLLAATFSPDGTRVLTASDGGTAHLWTVGFENLQARVRDVTTAVLSPDQRQRYLGESEDQSQQAFERSERA